MSSRTPTAEEMLERAALRVAGDETFIASLLREWCGGELDFEAIARFLGCPRASVVKLALCRRPPASMFQSDVKRIATHASVDEARLVPLLREAASLAAFRSSTGSQMLAAARDDRGPKKDDES